MSNSYIIELDDTAVGLVQRANAVSPFIFFASDTRFQALEGRTFPSPRAAEQAARAHRQQGGWKTDPMGRPGLAPDGFAQRASGRV
jgi:hypothetical protein